MVMNAETRQVAVHVAGYITKKPVDQTKYKCCVNYLTGELDKNNSDHDYVGSLSRGGLTIPSSHLTKHVCAAFAIPEHAESIITSSKLQDSNCRIEPCAQLQSWIDSPLHLWC